MIGPTDAAVNPLDSSQRYVLWGNGRIDNVGAPPITDNPEWYDRPDLPVAVALHIVDWTTGAGYVLDKQGGFHPINGAPSVGEAGEGDNATHEEVVGVIYAPFGARNWYVDWSWDPFHPGAGVVLDGFGKLWSFGGAPNNTNRPGNRWNVFVARKLQMDWATLKAYTMDYSGGLHPDFNAVSIPPFDDLARTFNGPRLPGDAPYWLKLDVARDFVITDWNTRQGYTLDHHGAVHGFNGAQAPIGFPYRKGGDHARILTVLSKSNPLRFWEVWSYGQEFEWVASTPPAVIAGGFEPFSPPTTVTTTTRPTLAWAYTDAQRDQQAAWELAVFTSAYATANPSVATDPAAHRVNAILFETGIDPNRRGITPKVDFVNGGYRMYVRSKDTADQWSAWAARTWTQNVPAPIAPAGLTATPDEANFAIALSVNATVGGSADSIVFEFSDDGGISWSSVRGAESLPIMEVVTAKDYDASFNAARQYRARSFNDDPRVISAPSNVVTTALVVGPVFALTSADHPGLGGRFMVQDPISWTQPVGVSVFEGIGAKFPIVVSDGVPKARRTSIRVVTLHEDAWRKLVELVQSNSTLVYRDPLGEVIYCRITGDLSVSKPKGSATAYQHNMEIPVTEIATPGAA